MNEKLTGAVANSLAHVVLQFMAKLFTYDKEKQAYLKTTDGWMNFAIGLTTEDGSVKQINLLEASCGFKLFVRSKHSARASGYGRSCAACDPASQRGAQPHAQKQNVQQRQHGLS